MDPFGVHDDAQLWDALKRAYLVEDRKNHSLDQTDEEVKEGSRSPVNRFSLDSPIEDEGGNLSIGQVRTCRAGLFAYVLTVVSQRSLVSLARALVKDSKILILDEATASVDYETDRKIQDTIANEFADRTILCIARTCQPSAPCYPHWLTIFSSDRLRTIIGYDRICVLDAGQIAEFDTPANLYSVQEGIFRSMCERSSISLGDIKAAEKSKEAQ